MNWLASDTEALRRLLFLIDEVPLSRQLRMMNLHFHGSRDKRYAWGTTGVVLLGL